jgi:NAD(P)-dependent dehydrogenase (short-subunit alcohol dehydrogenase family)
MQRVAYGRVVNISSGLGQLSQMGAGSPAYRVSKAALNALTATLAAEVKGQGILVNSMSPGWVRTDMGGPDAPRGVEEGAETAVWLALLPSNGPTGQFFRDRKPIPW